MKSQTRSEHYGEMVRSSSRYLKKRGRPREPRDLVEHDALVFSAGATPTKWSLVAGTKAIDVVVKPRLLVNDAIFCSRPRAPTWG